MLRASSSRDSPLTSHGALQARRLGAHLVGSAGPVSHVFSSDLQRASRTAEAIVAAQGGPATAQVGVVKVPELRERDFRSMEGQSWRTVKSTSTPAAHSLADAETHEEMKARADRFIDTHLRPVFDASSTTAAVEPSVVVVAHGIILGVLLRSLLTKFSPAELTRLSGPADSGRREYLATWSNTGYLEARVTREVALGKPSGNIALAVTAVNCVEHLKDLKKTKGGIGSAKFDGKQKTMDSFFGSGSQQRRTGHGRST